MRNLKFIIYLSIYLLENCYSAKILVFIPTPSISHQTPFRPLTQELAKRGHEVTVITADPAFAKSQAPENLTEISLHDLSYKFLNNSIDYPTGETNNYYSYLHALYKGMLILLEYQIKSEPVQSLIKDKTKSYDLLILEEWTKPLLIMSHIFKAPVIAVSSMGSIYGDYAGVGVPTHPFLYPSVLSFSTHNPSLITKLRHLVDYLRIEYVNVCNKKNDDNMLRKMFGPNVPTMSELSKNVDLYMLNFHPIWGLNIPVPPSVVHIAGIEKIPPLRKLPEELQNYLDSSKNGVIYLSLGTNAKSSILPQKSLRAIIETLSKLPYNVLWKYDKNQLPGNPNNIKIAKWFPQADVLRHPNVKLFITQGGLQSTGEAIAAGVPLIALPLFVDQFYNADQYVRHKIGKRIDVNSLTENEFGEAIREIINNKKYRENVIKLRDVMEDQPQPPLERAVWWIEHILRHGSGKHLRSPAANMTLAEYFEFELVLIVLFVFLTAFVVVIVSFNLIIIAIRTQFKKNKKLKSN